MKLLEVKNLKTHFKTLDGIVKAVDGISFDIEKGEILGIVGETGCGKSVTGLSVMRLLPKSAHVSGEILLDGEDLLKKPLKEMENIRQKRISLIFQEPMVAFDPLYTIGQQFLEVLQKHEKISKEEAYERSIKMLELVEIPAPKKRFDEYPHEFSGGMIQRVMIALALLNNPQLVIADEPTTGLDVSIQAQIINLIADVQKKLHTSTILITHDMGVVAELADEVMVMYTGKIVEKGPVEKIIESPLHPYTKGLIAAIPKLTTSKNERLKPIPGMVPSPYNLPTGCRFYPRCPIRTDFCKEHEPPYVEVEPNHFVACWQVNDGKGGVIHDSKHSSDK
jgi:oligopeptide/dipeptide ABC transporter ATP-binding protein